MVTRGGPAPARPIADDQRAAALLRELEALVEARDLEAFEAKQAELRALLAGDSMAAPPRDEAAIAAAVTEVEALLARVAELEAAMKFEELEPAYVQLREAVASYVEVETDSGLVLGSLERWSEMVFTHPELPVATKLQFATQAANEQLWAMRQALNDDAVEVALQAKANVLAIVAWMRSAEQPAIVRNADHLEARAKSLGAEARALQLIQRHELRVQGVLTGASNGQAVIGGRIVGDNKTFSVGGQTVLVSVGPPYEVGLGFGQAAENGVIVITRRVGE